MTACICFCMCSSVCPHLDKCGDGLPVQLSLGGVEHISGGGVLYRSGNRQRRTTLSVQLQ